MIKDGIIKKLNRTISPKRENRVCVCLVYKNKSPFMIFCHFGYEYDLEKKKYKNNIISINFILNTTTNHSLKFLFYDKNKMVRPINIFIYLY